MGRARYIAGFFALAAGLYFSLTWFFFGSSHPCGILEARQRSYLLTAYEAQERAMEKLLEMEPRSSFKEHLVEQFNAMLSPEGRELDLSRLRKRIWNLTPAQCAWRAIAWNPDPYKEGH